MGKIFSLTSAALTALFLMSFAVIPNMEQRYNSCKFVNTTSDLNTIAVCNTIVDQNGVVSPQATQAESYKGKKSDKGNMDMRPLIFELDSITRSNIITLVRSFAGQDFVETTVGLNMKMVYVEGGDFLMGATSEQELDGASNEQVIRRVRLDSYYIGECEVTQEQWTKVMGTSIQQQRYKASSPILLELGPDYPMYYVSWDEAMAFCQELSRMTGRTYCLPTEAQWEYAARGGKKPDGTKYSGSRSIDAVAWYDDGNSSGSHPVKNKRANGLGLYDMSGNVWEWCLDWYGDTYNVNDTNNPTGPSTGSYRVLRGGGWNNGASACRVSTRGGSSPGRRGADGGFRVVVLP